VAPPWSRLNSSRVEVGLWPRMNAQEADLLVYHVHPFIVHVTTLVLFKGVLFSRCLIPNKENISPSFPCNGHEQGEHAKYFPRIMSFRFRLNVQYVISIVIFSF
jgi:hypothetical protein